MIFFQYKVKSWMYKCFGIAITYDKVERNYRFLEEALELVQSTGCSKEDVVKLLDYVYDRPKGDPQQEVGCVMVTLAALCCAHHIDMGMCGDDELKRINEKIDQIREKQKNKPIKSPLPESINEQS